MSPHEGQEQVSPTLIPRHVAIIMDGNGRWAKQRGLPRMDICVDKMHYVLPFVPQLSLGSST